MQKKHAMVLSGGGALGAYEVGVMQALAHSTPWVTHGKGFDPHLFTGTSVGAFNSSFMAAQTGVPWQEGVARLKFVWLEIIANQGDGFGNGVFRYRLNPLDFLNPLVVGRFPLRTLQHLVDDAVSLSCDFVNRLRWFLEAHDEPIPNRLASLFDLSAFISMDPLEETLRKTIDYDQLSRYGTSVRIASTNWTSGQLDLAQQHDLNSEQGPRLIKGSVSIPGIFPPESFGGDDLVDGGVLMNTPLAPAIENGANEIHVVTLFPHKPTDNRRTLASTIGAMNRAQQFAWDFEVDKSMKNMKVADRILSQLRRLAAEVLRASLDSEQEQRNLSLLEGLRTTVVKNMGLPDHQYLTVHRFRPSQHIASNPLAMLLFERERIERLIELGFADTRDHDCLENGCITTSTQGLFAPHEARL